MRLLAISYMLPPALYPQAIQIGRLLDRLPAELGLVSGDLGTLAAGMEPMGDMISHPAFRLEIGYRPALSGLALNLARRLVPFYARVPDEFRPWVPLAEPAVVAELTRTKFRPDAILSFGEPMSDHLLALRLKRRLGMPWLAHFSDPWADNPFRRAQPLANIVNRRLEARVIAAVDRIVFTSAETRDLVMRKYPAAWHAKASVVPHSFDPALYPSPATRSGKLTLRYIGNFYGHRTPLPLLRALRLLLDESPASVHDIRVELVGRAPSWLRLHPVWRALPSGLVALVPPVPYRQALTLMVESDLLLVIDAADELSVFLPSKLVEYLGAGVPIFGIVPPGPSAKLIERLGGIVADPGDINAVTAGLRRALDQAQRERKSVEPWGDSALRNEYYAKNVAAEFARILDRMVRPTAG
jgi:glycosyltransferase involved in cell wall biosynthesis